MRWRTKKTPWEMGLGRDMLARGDWVEICSPIRADRSQREYGYVTDVSQRAWIPPERLASGQLMSCDFDFTVYIPRSDRTWCYSSSAYLRKLDVLDVMALPDEDYYPWEPPTLLWVSLSVARDAEGPRPAQSVKEHPYWTTVTIEG